MTLQVPLPGTIASPQASALTALGLALPAPPPTSFPATSTPSTTAAAAAPGETVFFTYSVRGLGIGPTIPALGFLTLDVLNPVVIMGNATADAAGTASFSATVPIGVPLIPLATQAVIMRGVGGFDSVISNPLLQTILP